MKTKKMDRLIDIATELDEMRKKDCNNALIPILQTIVDELLSRTNSLDERISELDWSM